MKVAIMQPYLFPYIGYFQLMNAVDEFVVYDNIQFSKKGWVNRNRILDNGAAVYITAPLKKDSDYLDIKDRWLAGTWTTERKKLLNRVTASYKKAPCFEIVYPVIEKCILPDEMNLFEFIFNSLAQLKGYLEIPAPFVISSSIEIDHTLKGEEKVISICKARKAKAYVNPVGGVELYDKDDFKKEGIDLQFLRTNDISYPQFNNAFVPSLSIIDVLMFNSKDAVKDILNSSFTLF